MLRCSFAEAAIRALCSIEDQVKVSRLRTERKVAS